MAWFQLRGVGGLGLGGRDSGMTSQGKEGGDTVREEGDDIQINEKTIKFLSNETLPLMIRPSVFNTLS